MIADKAFLRSFDRNIRGKFSYFLLRSFSMRVDQINHILLIDSGLPSDMFNILCCNGETDRRSVQIGINYFRQKQRPFAFWIGFEEEPPWLEKELIQSGLVTDETEWAMACDVTKCQESSNFTNIKQVQTEKEVCDMLYVMKSIFSKQEGGAIDLFYHQATKHLISPNSQLRFFIGYENKEPAAIVSLYFDEGLASIFDLIVIPKMRGKGLGKLMMKKAMVEAKINGFGTCILTATNDVRALYQKLGFSDIKTMKVYQSRSET